MYDRHQMQFIAVTFADGTVGIAQFVERAWSSRVSLDEEVYTAESTDENIEAFLDKLGTISPEYLTRQGWRRIEQTDLPTDRKNRNAWVDDGQKIAVDQAKVEGSA